MSASRDAVIPLSEPFHPPGARPVSWTPAPEERIRVTVVLRSRSPEVVLAATIARLTVQLPEERTLLDPQRFAETYGADPASLSLVSAFARRYGLRVVEASAPRCCVVLSGALGAVARAFNTGFAGYEDAEGFYRSHTGPLRVPPEVAPVVLAVLGLDDRPLLQRHGRPGAREAGGVDPRVVARAYGFPPRRNGRGQTIALIELGGGFHPADVTAYVRERGLRPPAIRVRSIDGHKNNPASPAAIRFVLETLGLVRAKATATSTRGVRPASTRPARRSARPAIGKEEALRAMWTIETTMDIQLVASLANGSAIEVYFAPGTAHGQYHALTAALESTEKPAVISCSFGSPEDTLPPSYLRAMDHALRLAALKGVTVCVSSGDKGDDAAGGRPRVHFPASSPYVLACGGTHLDPRRPFPERVWEEADMPAGLPALKSGGGVSSYFPEPSWQATARVRDRTGRSGRGVPDVAAKADLHGGYGIVVGGTPVTMGGTSAAAPLWAALVASLNQALGTRVGYLTPLLYTRGFRKATRDVTRGSNGAFRAHRGWDACTGWGSPIGTAVLSALRPSRRV